VNLNVIYGEPEDGSLDPAQVAALISVNPSAESAATTKHVLPANGSARAPTMIPDAASELSKRHAR
jgi:hypothetical protein